MTRFRAALTVSGLLALAACGATTAPELAVVPPESRADIATLAACSETSILLDRRVNFVPPLYDFLDAVRQSGCDYSQFRVDQRTSLSYNTNFSQSEAVDAVRAYRRNYALDWTAERRFEDPRIPEFHLRVVFLAPGER
jgi:hypothetical protein